MWARWVSTVRGESCSLRAISVLVCPSAISRSTSTSRGVSLSSVSVRCKAAKRVATRGLMNSSPRAAARIAFGSSMSARSFKTNPSAPATKARWTNTGLSSIVSTTISVACARLRSSPIASLPGPAGEAQVEHEHVWALVADVAQGRHQVACFGGHLHVVLIVEQPPQPAAHQGMVVGKHHTDGQRHGSRRRGPRRGARCQLQM